MLRLAGFIDFRRCVNGRSTDFDHLVTSGSDKDREMWGEGELRYFLKK